MFKSTGKANELFERLMQMPPNLDSIEESLKAGEYSPEEISMAATEYTDNCMIEVEFYDDGNYVDEDIAKLLPGEVLENHVSRYLYDVVSLLLPYGLDPNAVYGGKFEKINIMAEMRFAGSGYIPADTLALLLENGGDPNLRVDGIGIFDDLDFDVCFGAIEQEIRPRYDALVHCWFVMLGYGATIKDKDGNPIPLEVFPEYFTGKPFDISKLKNHRNYTFGLTHVPNRGEGWCLHIFDKRTLWEVARM